jgi:hypothetical protein
MALVNAERTPKAGHPKLDAILILFIDGAELLRRQIVREFPDAPVGQIGARLRALRIGRWRGPSVEDPEGVGELERLSALHRSGDLSEVELLLAEERILTPARP